MLKFIQVEKTCKGCYTLIKCKESLGQRLLWSDKLEQIVSFHLSAREHVGAYTRTLKHTKALTIVRKVKYNL